MTSTSDHPTEDLLTLHACGDGTTGERRLIAAHLAHCAECRQVVDAVAEIVRLSAGRDVPDPGPDFEARMWSRIAPALPLPRRRWSPTGTLVVSACAASLLLAVVAGTWLVRGSTNGVESARALQVSSGPRVDTSTDSEMQERVLFTALDAHLGHTEMVLVEILNAPGSIARFDTERAVADDLVSSGRLYRATAADTGHGLYSSLLDEVEPVLVEVARGAGSLDARDLEALRGRIVEGDLLFKVRAAARGARTYQDAGKL